MAPDTRGWLRSTATVDELPDEGGARNGVELGDDTGTLDGVKLDEASTLPRFSCPLPKQHNVNMFLYNHNRVDGSLNNQPTKL